MLATPKPSAAETHENAAFEALLWALSRPGLQRKLPTHGETVIVDALLDRECRVHATDPLLLPDIMRTGAEIAEIDNADHVFLGTLPTADTLKSIGIGSDLYPDDGATVILRTQIGSGQMLRLTGPGIDDAITLQLDGLPDGFWQTRATCLRYPVGFDLFFVDGDEVIGIPRSTQVEVL